MAHTYVTTRVSVSRRVFRATSFEINFLRTVSGGTGVPILRPSLRVGGCYIHSLSGTVSVNDMAWTQEGQCLNITRMDGCSRRLDEMSDTWARSQWHDRASCDGWRYPETQDGVKTCESCRWGSRWQDEKRHCIERPWPWAKARSSIMTWPCVEASWLCRRRLNMHMQMTCVVEHAWISHQRCLIGEDKPCLRSYEATKLKYIYMGLNSP